MLLRSLIRIRRAIEARAAAMSAGRRPRTMLLIALALWPAALVSAQVTVRPPDTMEARVLACASCHGEQGQGTGNDYFPRLAGKPAGYLLTSSSPSVTDGATTRR